MIELLQSVLASEGLYHLAGHNDYEPIKRKIKFFDSLDNAESICNSFLDEDRNVYFALGTFKDEKAKKPRGKDNVKFLKCIWLDIDSGNAKIYKTKDEALEALSTFLSDSKLPIPWIVDSGNGYHVYWPFDNPLTVEEWQPLAMSLIDLCLQHKLNIDAGVTKDAARILRVPNTKNFKSDPPKDVQVIQACPTEYDIDEIKNLLPIGEVVEVTKSARPAPIFDVKEKPELSNMTFLFSTLLNKSKRGKGCEQIKYAYENQKDVSYDLWRAVLSVAEYCEDKDTAIHLMSKDYEKYNPEETEKVTSGTRSENSKPFLCATFAQYNPGGCDKCIHKDKINSPYKLAKVVEEDAIPESLDDLIAPYKNVAPVEEVEEVVEEVEIEDQQFDEKTQYVMPKPYFRGKQGGIFFTTKDEEQKLIYKYDLFVTQRIYDDQEGESICFRLILPHDSPRNFTLKAEEISTTDTFAKRMANKGVLSTSYKLIREYVFAAILQLQNKKESDTAHHQFGWTNKKSFVVGSVEFTADGRKRYAPPTVVTSDMIDWYHNAGNLEEWKEVYNSYNKNGLEGSAFAALSAFGAPLLKIGTAFNGIFLNVKHNDSGSGKSTILRVINSVWGHPEKPLRAPHDTNNALAQRMGCLNNLPFTIDELSNTKPEEISNLLYAATQGRGKDRMENNRNANRYNKTTWSTITVTSGNSSYYGKLRLIKDSPKGELMRCVEYPVSLKDVISVEEGRRLFDDVLLNNYGLAWEPYMCAVQQNKEAVIERVRKMATEINKSLNLTSAYRFYSSLGAVNIVGGQVAQEKGLHDYNLKHLYEFFKDMVSQIRSNEKLDTKDHSEMLGRFLTDNHRKYTLIIQSTSDGRKGGNLERPQHEPMDSIKIRYEPDLQKYYVDKKFFTQYCAQQQIDCEDLIDALRTKKFVMGFKKKAMAKGTAASSLAIDTIVLDAKKIDDITYKEE